MSRRHPYLPRTPERVLRRNAPGGTDALVREIEASADRGMVVVVRCSNGAAFSIVANGVNALVRPYPLGDREPIGTYHDAASALRAGDRWAWTGARGEAGEDSSGDDWPRGAA